MMMMMIMIMLKIIAVMAGFASDVVVTDSVLANYIPMVYFDSTYAKEYVRVIVLGAVLFVLVQCQRPSCGDIVYNERVEINRILLTSSEFRAKNGESFYRDLRGAASLLPMFLFCFRFLAKSPVSSNR